jgi:hypothetical protein
MSEPDPTTSSTDTSSTPPGSKAEWRDQRRADKDSRREAMRDWRRERGWGGPPIGGFVLLAVGVMFLLGSFGFHLPPHWWALLILIPAVSLLVAAIRFYRADGATSGRVVGPAIGGFVLLAVALSLFFGFHGGFFWPIILIAVGAAIIARRNWWMRHQPPKA